jgi:hypothetical protein
MTISTLSPSCPQCGANKIVYSCEPKCCFNHVCGECRSTFQLQTRELNGKLSEEISLSELPEIESCLPMAACANCESTNVYQLALPDASAIQIVCADCRSLLELVFADNEE